MNTQRQKDLIIYRLLDYFMAMLAWICFFAYRKNKEVGEIDWNQIINDKNFLFGILLIPLWWIGVYFVFDKYKDIYRLSRLETFFRTAAISFFGVLFFVFTILEDDLVLDYSSYVTSFFVLFCLHFGFTVTARMWWLTHAKKKVQKGLIFYNTLIIGGRESAHDLYRDISSREYAAEHKFLGFIRINGKEKAKLDNYLEQLGTIDDIGSVIENENIEEVIIAVESTEHGRIQNILNILYDYNDRVVIKIIPDTYDILLGTVKMTHVYGAVLIQIDQNLMPEWQKLLKRIMDVSVCSILGVLLSPLLAFIAIKVRLSSKGSILFSQERIGKNWEPFDIYKFRSMYTDAEDDGPQLSQDGDDRCTPWGAKMRKWRLDELPQLWNVIKGDMSLVGPRPERQFYIDQLVERAPHYKQLLRVRPGITSWGQVKYGYASNIEQMLQRLKFDILYIENMSVLLDIKILFYTVIVLIQGKGK